MTSRWICRSVLAVLAASIALAGCEKRKAPAAEPTPAGSAVEPAPAPTPIEPTPAPTDPAPAAGSAAPDPAAPADPAKPGDKPADPARPGDKPADQTKPADPAKGDKPADQAGGGGDRKCGGIAGFRCKAGEKCRYAPSTFSPHHPDAMGACVAETYCDAPADCEGLMHIMVVGAWQCAKKSCAWKAQEGAPQ